MISPLLEVEGIEGRALPHSVGFVRRTNSTPEIQPELIDSCAECGRVQA